VRPLGGYLSQFGGGEGKQVRAGRGGQAFSQELLRGSRFFVEGTATIRGALLKGERRTSLRRGSTEMIEGRQEFEPPTS